MARTLSFRTRILLLVLVVGLVPLAVMGVWLTGRMTRSGEALLRERLRTVLEEERATIERRWIPYRSALLDLAEHPAVSAVLAARENQAARSEGPPVPAAWEAAFRQLDAAVQSVRLLDLRGDTIWSLSRMGASPAGFGQPLRVALTVYETATGEERGTLVARIHLNALRRPGAGTGMVGALLTAVDPETGVELLPTPVDGLSLADARFRWNGEIWLVERTTLVEPRIVLRAAAALAPFAGPLQAAARNGLWIILIVAAGGLAVAWALTGRITGSLERLSDAAAAVAAGELDRRVDVAGDDEIGRLARAFNTMTENLRRTLARLSERESLAAVNEFAAALAHEVRNPLTAIRLDLQQVEEGLPKNSPLRPLQAQALADIRHLDRTVGAALETARSGRIESRRFDLREPLRAAVRGAMPAFREADAELSHPEPPNPVHITGDPDALERVVLNLLLNAADAVDAGGRTILDVAEDDDGVRIRIEDDGRGMTADELSHAFDPFFTTRPRGTGVGLPVARRIVAAHGGEIRLDSTPGAGTTAEIELPNRNTSFRSP